MSDENCTAIQEYIDFLHTELSEPGAHKGQTPQLRGSASLYVGTTCCHRKTNVSIPKIIVGPSPVVGQCLLAIGLGRLRPVKMRHVMAEFLVGFSYHEPESYALWNRGVIEDYESSTGVFIEASSPDEALEWAERIAEALLRKCDLDESLKWADWQYQCWIEEEPEESDWKHCLAFFQRVRSGEWPVLEKMDTPAYAAWMERSGG